MKRIVGAIALVAVWAVYFPAADATAKPAAAKPAASARALPDLLANLQANPSDAVLRKQVILTARATVPSLPADAAAAASVAAAFSAAAKSTADWARAADAWNKAALLAPWMAEYYLKAADADEKAGQSEPAIAALDWYLFAAPGAPNAGDVAERIGGLKYAQSLALTPQGQAALKRQQFHEVLTTLDRRMFVRFYEKMGGALRFPDIIEIHGEVLHHWSAAAIPGFAYDNSDETSVHLTGLATTIKNTDGLRIDRLTRSLENPLPDSFDVTFIISDDGTKITRRANDTGTFVDQVFELSPNKACPVPEKRQ